MESHGGDVELLALEDGVARLRLQGSCTDCSASAVDARAGDQAGARRGRARPRRPRGRGRAPRPGPAPRRIATAARWPAARTASWVDARRRAGARRRASCVGAEVGRRRGSWSPTSTARCWPTATRCAGCGGAAARRRRSTAGALHLPARASAAFFLPRAGRSLDDDRLQLEPVPLLREQGRVKVALARERGRPARPRGRGLTPAAVAPPACAGGSRRCAATRPSGAAAAGAAADGERCDLCGTGDPRRPPPPAAPRRAADRLRRARACWAMRSGDAELPADRQPDAVARRTSTLPDELWAQLPDPDRARVLHGLDASPAASSRSTRARPARPSASSTSRPGAGWSSSTRCSTTLEPDIEALIVNRLVRPAGRTRSRRSTAATSSTGTIKAQLGGHLRRRRRRRRRSPRSSTSCAREAVRGMSVGRSTSPRRRAERRPSPSSRSSARARCAHAAAPTLRVRPAACREPSGREVYMIALTIADR